MFAEFYDSFVQHPLLLWVAAVVGLAIALRRPGLRPSVRRFCVALTIVSLVDAWLTTNDVPGLGPLTGGAATWVPLAFVLIGDFRYFLFIESARRGGTLVFEARHVARALAWTLVVPIASQLVTTAMGSTNSRVLFLVYEALFVVLAIGISAHYLPKHTETLAWTRGVTRFVIGYYALWAGADAIILVTGADAGFLLRVAPNILYYGGLVPVIAWTAPKMARTKE
ncbi:MAG: hypothetical protein WBG86_04110 [Polyangiales bacterium]